VTGANRVWIAGPHSLELPSSVLFPSVTKAIELFKAGEVLSNTSQLRDVIDIPSDLDVFTHRDRIKIEAFLRRARLLGADKGYVAENRKSWWSVGLRAPAPILATYMARRKPAFVRNVAGARHINIAHGIYPREEMTRDLLDRLCRSLSGAVSLSGGRTYAGGLTKFEPKEMERILIPNPAACKEEQVA
jgi:adenine-specific DNA-methyltransferase